jgi:uncharacterized membrane protein affecting hemolysin expression
MSESASAVRGHDAEQALKIFEKFGADGRAISASSLIAYLRTDQKRLAATLEQLLSAGLIRQAGVDPFARERAYRLANPLAGRAPPESRIAA